MAYGRVTMPDKIAPKLTKRTIDALAADGRDAVF